MNDNTTAPLAELSPRDRAAYRSLASLVIEIRQPFGPITYKPWSAGGEQMGEEGSVIGMVAADLGITYKQAEASWERLQEAGLVEVERFTRTWLREAK